MTEVVVASYNMSFMSDLEKPLTAAQWASEATFLTGNTGERREYWENAKELLRRFIMMTMKNKKLPFVIGLQEMNLTADGSNTGSGAITQMLSTTIKNARFEHICREVFVSEYQKPALSIIYDKTAFGKSKQVRILDNWCQPGRPLLMVLTELGYVFANMHGAQNPDDGDPYKEGNQRKFNESMVRMNKRFLENSLEEFLKCNGFNQDTRPTGIFITGDFNDRYDAIEEFDVFGVKLQYRGESPYSCCHNWDSSCSDDNYNLLRKFRDDKVRENSTKGAKEGNYYCEIPDANKRIDPDTKLKLPMPSEESEIQLYRYKGDKVFGEIDDDEKGKSYGKIEIFNYYRRHWKPSQESDHELVYAKFPYKSKQYIIPGKLQETVPGNAHVEYEFIDKSDPDLTKRIKNYTLHKRERVKDIEGKYDKRMWELTFRNKTPDDGRPLYKTFFWDSDHFGKLEAILGGGKRRKTRQYKRKNSRKTRRHR
jgi:hypothetical protein